MSDPRELATILEEMTEAVSDFGPHAYSLPRRERVRLLRRIGELVFEGLQSTYRETEDGLEDVQ